MDTPTKHYEEFRDTINDIFGDLTLTLNETESLKRKVLRKERSVELLSLIHEKLKTVMAENIDISIVGLRDELKNKYNNARDGYNEIGDMLSDMVNYRTTLNRRLIDLKSEIDQLIADNQRLELKLAKPSDPLVSKLMNSLSDF